MTIIENTFKSLIDQKNLFKNIKLQTNIYFLLPLNDITDNMYFKNVDDMYFLHKRYKIKMLYIDDKLITQTMRNLFDKDD